jgi:hypothetical protein
VAQSYGVCALPVAMIVGPVGGGKSTESLRRYLRIASWQQPSPIDGVRRARILCLCPTYRRAWDQIIPSYFEVYPRSMGTFTGARGDPAEHIFDIELNTGREIRKLHVEVWFRAVNDLSIEDFFRGMFITAIHLPEADTNGDLDQILSFGQTRLGRYPEPHHRPSESDAPTYSGIFGDANAPIINSPFHLRFYTKKMPDGSPTPATDRLFRQPGGNNPNAENMAALRRIRKDFYAYQATQIQEYDRRRMIDCIPSFGRHGQPVHPNFDDQVHRANRRLEPDPLLQVFIGIDAGSNALTPGVTFSQRAYSGQWRKLAEIYLGKGQMNTQELGDEIVRIMNARFGCLHRDVGAMLCLDPAAGGKNAGSEYTTAMALQGITQIEAQLAPSNKPEHRHSVTDALFKRMVAPKEPAIIIDPDCVGLLAGYAGGYHYKKRAGGLANLAPEKNEYSHVVEADEYTHLTADGLPAGVDGFIRLDGRHSDDGVRVILPD